MRILAIGEILFDIFGPDEKLGGAPLNVVVNAARLGHEGAILSGVGDDARGDRARRAIRALGLDDRFIATIPGAPTGVATVHLDPAGAAVYDFPRPAAYDLMTDRDGLVDDVVAWDPDWIVFGTLAQAGDDVRDVTDRISRALPGCGRLYDVNLRAGQYTSGLVLDRLARATVVKFNEDEAAIVAAMTELPAAPPEVFCRGLAGRFDLRGVCVTRGADGSTLLLDGAFATAGAYPVHVVDTVGAGDAFGATLLHGIGSAEGTDVPPSPAAILDLAARVAGLVASRPGGTPDWTLEEALTLR